MNDFFHYLIEVNILLALFAVAYAIFFRHTPHHVANRAVLNGSVLLSLLLPLVEWTASEVAQITVWLDPLIIGQNTPALAETGSTSVFIVWMVYLAGIVVTAAFTLRSLPPLLRLLKTRQRDADSRYFMVERAGLAPGSFMRTLFLDSKLTAQEREAITAHEMVHIREWHTLDHLLFRALTIVCWFNPAVYLMQRMLTETHEFRADFMAEKNLGDHIVYPEILLSRTFGVSRFPTLPFTNQNLLKQRIMMITDPIRHKSKAWRYAFLPLLLIPAMLIHSCSKKTGLSKATPQEQSQNLAKETSEDKTPDETTSPYTVPQKNEDGIYTMVDEMPEFPGGQAALISYLGENIQYPEAVQSEVQGVVFVSFIIDEEGNVTEQKVVRSPDPAFSAVSLEAVLGMPQWSPGKQDGVPVKVHFMLPLRFELAE